MQIVPRKLVAAVRFSPGSIFGTILTTRVEGRPERFGRRVKVYRTRRAA